MTKKNTFYITSPLYYLNANPHIGHAYTTIAADIVSRHKRAKGEKVFFQTGTDEHGSNIEKIAEFNKIEPKQWVDKLCYEFKKMWQDLHIIHDNFIRTTDPGHEEQVQLIFDHLIKTGDIYLGTYEGLYCSKCENFYEEKELINGDCPVHKKKVENIKEETFFFKLSKYEDKLLKHYENNPDFLSPKHRSKEIINFAKAGLKDISFSRTKVSWGIPVKSNPNHTVYVWFDALLNYITGAGYQMEKNDPEKLKKFESVWPADVHLVGKEIYRFHAIIWPAVLMALDLPLPKKIYAHGWWTVNGEKMSKSKGNFVNPMDMTKEYGLDSLRYFLFREVPFGQDGDFSFDSLKQRYNADLANDLGNLFSRILNLSNKYLGKEMPEKPENSILFDKLSPGTAYIDEKINNLQFGDALNKVWEAVSLLNKEVDSQKPWALAKTDLEKAKFFLKDSIWCLRLIAGWIYPFMPNTSAQMQMYLGIGKIKSDNPENHKLPPLFPRKQ